MDNDIEMVQSPLVTAEPVQVPERDWVTPDEGADAWGFEYIPPEHRTEVVQATQFIHTCMANIAGNLFERARARCR